MNTDPDLALLRALAEDAGWKQTTECPDCFGTGYEGSEMDHYPCETCNRTGKTELHFRADPAIFVTDRDAIMELVLGLSDFQLTKFAEELMEECHWHPIGVVTGYERQKKALGKLVTSTARQLAMAYARVKKLQIGGAA